MTTRTRLLLNYKQDVVTAHGTRHQGVRLREQSRVLGKSWVQPTVEAKGVTAKALRSGEFMSLFTGIKDAEQEKRGRGESGSMHILHTGKGTE